MFNDGSSLVLLDLYKTECCTSHNYIIAYFKTMITTTTITQNTIVIIPVTAPATNPITIQSLLAVGSRVGVTIVVALVEIPVLLLDVLLSVK